MRNEIDAAAQFLSNLLRLHSKVLASEQLEQFRDALAAHLSHHYANHWFPDSPNKGSAYRCIRINHKMDPLLSAAGRKCGLDQQQLMTILPNELTMWIDPREVSYRIGESGSICVLFDGTGTSSDLKGHIPSSQPHKTAAGSGGDNGGKANNKNNRNSPDSTSLSSTTSTMSSPSPSSSPDQWQQHSTPAHHSNQHWAQQAAHQQQQQHQQQRGGQQSPTNHAYALASHNFRAMSDFTFGGGMHPSAQTMSPPGAGSNYQFAGNVRNQPSGGNIGSPYSTTWSHHGGRVDSPNQGWGNSGQSQAHYGHSRPQRYSNAGSGWDQHHHGPSSNNHANGGGYAAHHHASPGHVGARGGHLSGHHNANLEVSYVSS